MEGEKEKRVRILILCSRESNAKLGDKGMDRSGNDLPGMPLFKN